jgi:imidazolonepropionase-like amidohydrolase
MGNYVLLAKTILAGDRLAELHNGCVVVRDRFIEHIGTQEHARKPAYSSYEPIDLGDGVVMPGMIDSHNHTSLDARLDGHLEMMNDTECALTIRAIKSMRDDLLSGVTSTRCVGEKHYIDVTLRNEINAGRVDGPRLQVSGIGMRSIHGHGYVGVPHTGEQEIRKTCRENLLRRVDLLKIFVTGGAPPPRGTFIPSFLSLEEISTVVAEARRAGVRTAAHCIGGEGLTNCITAGIDIIEHGYCVTAADLELIKEHDKFVCVTASVFMDVDRNTLNPPGVAEAVDRGRERAVASMKKIVKSGVKYAIGTDAMHGALHRDAVFVRQLGASNFDALMGVTVNAAKLCATDDVTGSLAVGKYADIIAVSDNPLADVAALKNVRFVMKEGRRYR